MNADEELAILKPVKRTRRQRRRSGIVTHDDSLWNIVGMASSEGPVDVARNKHRYLAEAYAGKDKESPLVQHLRPPDVDEFVDRVTRNPNIDTILEEWAR